jgi:hypothetical protein
MSDDPVEVVVAFEPSAEVDSDVRDRLVRQLRAELRDLDLDAIADIRRGDAPSGAKGVELAEWGVWLVTLSASGGVLTSLISVAKDWLDRRGAGNRIKITIDGDTLELDGASSTQQAALLEAFVQRHQATRPHSPR